MRNVRRWAWLLILVPTRAFGQDAKPEDPQWWRDAKFGVFICWGPVSIMGTEIGWSRKGPRPGHRSKYAKSGVPLEVYDNLYKKFNPTKFDAKEWVDIIKDSGAKYMIFLTKHHDGFCMFHTKYTDYSIASTPFKRDVTGELAKACQEAGIRIFWYYSQPDCITRTIERRTTAATSSISTAKFASCAQTTARSTASGSTASAAGPKIGTASACSR